jgi:hypothetical protein
MGTDWATAKRRHVNTQVGVTLAMASDAAEEAERLVPLLRRLRDADGEREDLSEQVHAMAERIHQLECDAEASEVTFLFRGIGRGHAEKLRLDHPLPEAMKGTKAAELVDWDPATLPPALMAASCVEPAELAGNVEEWQDIHDNWSEGQVAKLWRACLQANQGVADTPKSALVSAILTPPTSETS